MNTHHKVKCRFCKNKVDIDEIIRNKDYEVIPYYKEDRNKEWIVFECPFCNQDNLHERIVEEE